MLKNTGSTPDSPAIQSVPAYLPEDQAKYTPVLDDLTGRTDQVSFGIRGIPSLGDIGQYDSSINPLVGGDDNPYPSDLPEEADDLGRVRAGLHERLLLELQLLGVRHRARARRLRPALDGLLRGIEFIATWFSYALASPEEGGSVAEPDRPIAYFEMTPKKPTAQTTVSFDAGFSRTKSGYTDGLTYYWDFGDGTPMVMTDHPRSSTRSRRRPRWRDVKLLVAGAGQWDSPEKFGSFRQVEPIDFFPTYYPAVAPPAEPAAPTTGRRRPVRRVVCRRADRADRGGPRREAKKTSARNEGRPRGRPSCRTRRECLGFHVVLFPRGRCACVSISRRRRPSADAARLPSGHVLQAGPGCTACASLPSARRWCRRCGSGSRPSRYGCRQATTRCRSRWRQLVIGCWPEPSAFITQMSPQLGLTRSATPCVSAR